MIAEDLAYLRNPIWWAGMVTSALCPSPHLLLKLMNIVIVGEGGLPSGCSLDVEW